MLTQSYYALRRKILTRVKKRRLFLKGETYPKLYKPPGRCGANAAGAAGLNNYWLFLVLNPQTASLLYSKEQASSIKQSFWKAFGQYMALQPSAEGLKVNWINYKTGIRHLSFKMQAGNQTACIMIELSPPDGGIRELMFDQLLSLKPILDGYPGRRMVLGAGYR